MQYVFLTAFGVGGATIIGALLGFLLGKISQKRNGIILGFAAGLMLAAAVYGLILPSAETVGAKGIWLTAVGIMCGTLFLNLTDKLTPRLQILTGLDLEEHRNSASLDNVMLFITAIIIHKFPEGMAAGVAFGTGDTGSAVSVALGIALHNIPEGMVIISPMLSAGISKARTFATAILTGAIEIAGTFVGFFAASISAAVLPFLLAFAGGTMLYVIVDEMIPKTHVGGSGFCVTFATVIGFVFMTVLDAVIA
ncbi:MAG: ZIP family metal transporter [Clostridia bacterium]|nr:ZIP family metal transporter [Clostridia bacterium]